MFRPSDFATSPLPARPSYAVSAELPSRKTRLWFLTAVIAAVLLGNLMGGALLRLVKAATTDGWQIEAAFLQTLSQQAMQKPAVAAFILLMLTAIASQRLHSARHHRVSARGTDPLAVLRRIGQAVPGLLYAYDVGLRRLERLDYGNAAAPAPAILPPAIADLELLARVHEDSRAALQAHRGHYAGLGDHETALLTFRLRQDDDSLRWITTSDTVLARDTAGAVTHILCCLVDVTEKQQTTDALRKLTAGILSAQDAERRRIARDLHDTTAQNLLAAQFAIRDARGGREVPASLDQALALVAQSQEEIRTLSYLLHPPLLDEVGLGAALAWYAQGFQKRTGIATRVNDERSSGHYGDARLLSPEAETILFRVAQEALTNVYRHAQAGSVSIRISTDTLADRRQALTVTVTDDGRGFDAPGRQAGVGLMGMRERLHLVGGALALASAPGVGTTIRATCPADMAAASSALAAQPTG